MQNKELYPHPPYTKVDAGGYDSNGYRGGWMPLPKPKPIKHFYEYKRKLLQPLRDELNRKRCELASVVTDDLNKHYEETIK